MNSIVVLYIYIKIVSILSHLGDSAQVRRGSYFQAQALYLSLRTIKGVNTIQIMFFEES